MTTLEECVVTFSRGKWKHYDKIVIVEEWRNRSGEYHRPTDDPALIIRDPESSKILEQHFYRNGQRSRVCGPAMIRETNRVISKEWWVDGLRHRPEEDGPSQLITQRSNGVIVREAYHQNGIANRTGKPQSISRNGETGIVSSEVWKKDGKFFHPHGGAVYTEWNEMTGELVDQEFSEEPSSQTPLDAPTPLESI